MKRLYLLLIMLLVVFDVSAQENNSRLNVKSLKLIENDTEASRAKKKDGNGDFCALIKIQTPNMNEDERNKLHFSADLGTFTYLDEAIGEVKLFLTEGCKTLIIMHPDYGKLVYSMPIKVAGLRTYEMVLEANKEFVAPVMTISNNYVIINAKPKDATITIDGKYCANGKASISVGEPHKLVVTHDLYHSYEKEIYASPDEKITYDVNLYPAFGWLVINSEPENGAAVFINGERKGVTPFRSDTLKSGDYDVELQKDMFAPVRKTVKVLDNNDAEISIPMQKTHNYVVINATPKDVNITIDGNYYKNGKALLSIGEPHDLVVSRKFYHSEESVVYAMPNEIKTFDMILKSAFGWISINSKPETGATILINGKKIGQTPFKTDTLPSGEYEVTLLKEMYVSVTEHIVVRDNKTTEITLPLNPSFAEISLTTETESSIYIDGELKGKGSWKGRLMEGSYLVESRKPSHRTVSKSVDVYAGLAATIDIGNPIPIYGALDINTDPDEAEIYLDGVKIGETPLIYKNVLIGSHTLKFVKKGCATFIKEVSVEENKLLNVNEKLDSGKVISITTGRNGDDIYVDGELVGKSPMDMAMGYGSHSVKAVRNGKKVEKEIEVMINGGPTSLTLEFGKIVKITTDRKGDDVFVDGKLVGKSPLEIDLSFGTHDIKSVRDKKSDERRINIQKTAMPTNVDLYLRAETPTNWVRNGVWFATANVAIMNTGLVSYGVTVGSVKIVGWFVSVMSNFNFKKADFETDGSGMIGGVYPAYTTSKNSRLSITGGLAVKIYGPLCFRLGAGYGKKEKLWNTQDGKVVKYSDESYSGIDASFGLQMNIKGITVSLDAVTTNFKTLEAKIGIGCCIRKK